MDFEADKELLEACEAVTDRLEAVLRHTNPEQPEAAIKLPTRIFQGQGG